MDLDHSHNGLIDIAVILFIVLFITLTKAPTLNEPAISVYKGSWTRFPFKGLPQLDVHIINDNTFSSEDTRYSITDLQKFSDQEFGPHLNITMAHYEMLLVLTANDMVSHSTVYKVTEHFKRIGITRVAWGQL
ncbi:hypothetical protein [Catenovulum agarivorans]|uniref:hypothetical protein n=1 Tax=Catenovulum agarivorans TaxID=1172192 RepID=UPI00036A6E26|nr:hypothetical protein [Catenovulum agarivorans]